jgi:hypothetical protein
MGCNGTAVGNQVVFVCLSGVSFNFGHVCGYELARQRFVRLVFRSPLKSPRRYVLKRSCSLVMHALRGSIWRPLYRPGDIALTKVPSHIADNFRLYLSLELNMVTLRA